MDPRARDLVTGYAPLASAYADALLDELGQKPLDRALLRAFAEQTAPHRVLEVGCGPGQVARFLRDQGANVEGTDLSPAMIAEARRRHADTTIEFEVADMRALPHADGALGGVVAFYAIVHSPTAELMEVFREFRRVLRPGGLTLISFHIGAEQVNVTELFGVATSLDFHFHPVDAVENALREVGLGVLSTLIREPYEGAEHPSRRAYVLAGLLAGEPSARHHPGAHFSKGTAARKARSSPAPPIGASPGRRDRRWWTVGRAVSAPRFCGRQPDPRTEPT